MKVLRIQLFVVDFVDDIQFSTNPECYLFMKKKSGGFPDLKYFNSLYAIL
jgi:hypothetical protein